MLWLMLLSAIMVSCSDSADVTTAIEQPSCDILFNIRTPGSMRMANEVIQTEESLYRGMKIAKAIPFQTSDAGTVTASDEPLWSTNTAMEANKVTGRYYYYIEHSEIAEGTNRMLVYGQASSVTGKNSKKENGVLLTTLTDDGKPADITFKVQEIQGETTATSEAQALADYLTAIAKTEGWSTTTDATLRQLYIDFLHADPEGTGLMNGSAAYVTAHVEALRSQLEDRDDDLSQAILANIDDETLNGCLTNGYPAELPDGAAALRWAETATDTRFSVRTTNTTMDNINGINRYAYPAELWYYVNSAINTSTVKVKKTTYESSETWEIVLSNYPLNEVDWQTKAVAVTSPLQYAVGRLQTVMKAITETLYDTKGETVEDGTAENLPLTGVIIGGQHTVGFDFKPQEPQSDVDARFIYDAVVSEVVEEGANAGDAIVNTLVLQSYDNEKVPVALEFQNNTGHPFHAMDGIVYPGTKFYLVAYLNPAGQGTGDCAGRVFTQDYTTTARMTVTSLGKAYTTIPNLLEPHLEIGVQVETKWIQSTTTTVRLFY